MDGMQRQSAFKRESMRPVTFFDNNPLTYIQSRLLMISYYLLKRVFKASNHSGVSMLATLSGTNR